MDCRLTNVKAHDSATYGLEVEFRNKRKEFDQSFLKVVDLTLDAERSDEVVQSWIGNPTVLKCAIHKKTHLKANYEWSAVSEAKDITQGITRDENKTSYTFIPLSKWDFGKYKCTIKTAATTIEHEILLQQISYAGAPEGLSIDITDGGRFLRLVWNQPKDNGGTKIISYEIIVQGDGVEIRKDTTKLSAGVKLTDDNRYVIRVCSRNKIGIRIADSCTPPYEKRITQSPQKGNKDRVKARLLNAVFAALITVMVWIT